MSEWDINAPIDAAARQDEPRRAQENKDGTAAAIKIIEELPMAIEWTPERRARLEAISSMDTQLGRSHDGPCLRAALAEIERQANYLDVIQGGVREAVRRAEDAEADVERWKHNCDVGFTSRDEQAERAKKAEAELDKLKALVASFDVDKLEVCGCGDGPGVDDPLQVRCGPCVAADAIENEQVRNERDKLKALLDRWRDWTRAYVAAVDNTGHPDSVGPAMLKALLQQAEAIK